MNFEDSVNVYRHGDLLLVQAIVPTVEGRRLSGDTNVLRIDSSDALLGECLMRAFDAGCISPIPSPDQSEMNKRNRPLFEATRTRSFAAFAKNARLVLAQRDRSLHQVRLVPMQNLAKERKGFKPIAKEQVMVSNRDVEAVGRNLRDLLTRDE